MAHPQQTTRTTLLEHGFRPRYETAALSLLEHPDHPGYLIRLGVTRVVVEHQGREVYRAAYGSLSIEQVLEILTTCA